MIHRLSLPGAITLVAALSVARLVCAQDPPAPPTAAETPPTSTARPATAPPAAPEAPRRGTRPGDIQKVFVLQYVEAPEMAKLLGVFPAQVNSTTNPRLQALSVSGPPAVVAAIEETIKRLDAAPVAQNVVITAYILEGLTQPDTTPTLPAEIHDAVAQLEQMLGFASYRLVDTVIVRGTHQGLFEGSSEGTRANPQRPTLARMNGRIVVARGIESTAITLRNFTFRYRVPVSTGSDVQHRESHLRSDLEIRDGQTVVVGKTAPGEAGGTQILVLRARLVD